MASSTNVGSIHYDLGLDTSEFDRKSKDTQSKLATLGGKMKKFARGAAVVGASIGAVGFGLKKGFIDPAADLVETINKVDVAFGDSAEEIKQWSENSIEQFGIAGSTAMETASLFGDMATSMGVNTGDAADMSKGLTGLAGDLASFKNIGIDQATTALAGVFTGETESLKKLGIVMTQANLKTFAMKEGTTKTIDEMTQAEKVNLRYRFILSRTTNAQGDFARTSSSAANQTRQTGERIKELREQIGARLIPAYQGLLIVVNRVIQFFSNLVGGTSKANQMFSALGNIINTHIAPVFNFLAEVFKANVTPELNKLWAVVKKQLIPALKAFWKRVGPILIPVLKALAVVLGSALIGALRLIIASVRRAISVMSWFFNMIARVLAIIRTVARTFKAAFNSTKNIVNNKINEILNKIKNFKDKFFKAGRELILSVGRGIKNAARAAKDKVDEVLSAIRNKLPFSDAKEGPLSDLTLSGKRFSETFAKGITQGAGNINDALNASLANPVAALGSARRQTQVQNTNTNIYGNMNFKNQQDVDYFINRISRDQSLLGLGMSQAGSR